MENGPIVSEDDVESKEGQSEVKETLEASFNSEDSKKSKKVQGKILTFVKCSFFLLHLKVFPGLGDETIVPSPWLPQNNPLLNHLF